MTPTIQNTYNYPYIETRREGWICPRCGAVNSPDVYRCYCSSYTPEPPMPRWYIWNDNTPDGGTVTIIDGSSCNVAGCKCSDG